ncbi:hypothetical protein Tco_1368420 [Tanacetum coccineum]
MRTRSSSNLVGEYSPNPTTSNPKCRNRRRSKQPFNLEEPLENQAPPVVTMADQRTMAELLCAPTEGYAEAMMVPPILAEPFELKHKRSTQDVLTIIENESKVRNSQNKSIISQVKSSDVNSSSSSDLAKLTHAVNQQTSAVTTAMTAILKQFQATPPPASVKAVEEICVAVGRLLIHIISVSPPNGNTFPEYRDNIQGYVAAAAGNYNQGNSGYRPPGVANQTRPPVPTQQNQVVPLSELEKIKKMNKRTTTSYLGMGTLPANIVVNPKGKLKAITTRSGLVLDGPFVPMPPPFINPKEDERVEETLTDQDLAEFTIKSHLSCPKS